MKTTVWELWEYDVWGNEEDGWTVNDRSCIDRAYTIRSRGDSPSDYQIRKAFGLGCKVDIDGDDTIIYVDRERDGLPIGEMLLITHAE